MLRYSILDARTGRRLASVSLTWRERAAIHTDGDGSVLAGDLPEATRRALFACGVSPLARVVLIRSLRQREELSRA